MVKKGRTVKQAYFFNSAPESVFGALTNSKKLTKWFLSKARFSPRRGGEYSFTWLGGYRQTGKVRRFVRDRFLTLSWPNKLDNGKEVMTEVAFTISPKGKGTLLRLVHTGFKEGEGWTELYGGVQAGWAYYLMNLKAVLDHGIDLRSKYDV
jgi:uncharacterized protein YndB with AHSA1/START domain